MIAYFADRNLNILISSSTDLPGGLVIKEDLKTEEIETGVASFSGSIGYNDSNDVLCEKALTPGNYVLRKVKEGDDECGIFTIIDMEKDSKSQNIEFSAEDAGLELLNDIALKWPDDDNVNPSPMTLGEYAEMWLDRTGFEIGRDESGSTTKSLSWDQEHTVSNRLLDIASEFGCELNYSFEIEGFRVTKKLVNFYKRRGSDNGVQWRMNKEIDRIVTKATIANLATALLCYGSIPDGATLPITLADFSAITTEGYTIEQIYYADREGRATQGWCLCSSEALKRWGTVLSDGSIKHAVRPFHVETLDQAELYRQGLAELQKIENVEYNFEVDVSDPRDAKIGDTVNIVDEAGRLYLSARLLKLETSEADGKKTATLGDYMFRSSGISEKVRELANQFSGMVVPQITVERNDVTGVTTITATDKNGTTTAEVYDGAQGPQGPAGADGADGDDAPTIVSVIQQWCMSSTRNTFTKATNYDWQDTMPAYVSGLYYYTRTKTTYNNGNITYSTPVLDLSAQVSAESSAAASAAAAAAAAAKTAAENAERDAEQAASDAETARNTAVNTANEAKGIAEGTKKHFWYDDSGAHVSDVENSVATGNSVSISSSAIVIMRNGKLVASWTGSSSSDSALNFYDCSNASARDADLVSSYARSGITYYVNNKRAMSLVSSGLTFWDPTDTTNAGTANQRKQALFAPASVNLYAEGHIAANFAANSLNFYDGSSASASADNLLASYTRAGITMYTRYSGASANTRAMSLTASGLTFWDPSDTTNSGTTSQRKEAVFGSTGVELYKGGNKVASFGDVVEMIALNSTRGTRAVELSGNGFYLTDGTNVLAGFGFVNKSNGYPDSGYVDLGHGVQMYVERSTGHVPSGFTPDEGALDFYTNNQRAMTIHTDKSIAFINATGTFAVTEESITVGGSSDTGAKEGTKILTKTGYYPVGVVGFSVVTTNAYSRGCYLTDVTSGSCTLRARLWIQTASTGGKACTAYVLWIRNE